MGPGSEPKPRDSELSSDQIHIARFGWGRKGRQETGNIRPLQTAETGIVSSDKLGPQRKINRRVVVLLVLLEPLVSHLHGDEQCQNLASPQYLHSGERPHLTIYLLITSGPHTAMHYTTRGARSKPFLKT